MSVTIVVHELGSPITTVEGKQVRLVEVVLGVAWIEVESELAEWVASPRYSLSMVTVSTAEGTKLTEQLAEVIDPTSLQEATVKEPAPLLETLTVPDGAIVAPGEVSVTTTPHKLVWPTATGELHDRVVDVSVTIFTTKLVELERARGFVPATFAVYVPAGAEPVATCNVDVPGISGVTSTTGGSIVTTGPEGEMEAVRFTVPVKPLTLLTTILAFALAPLWIPRGLGVIVIPNF